MYRSIVNFLRRLFSPEMLLAASLVTLALQLLPGVRQRVSLALDVTQWSRTTWFVVNLAAALALVAVRFSGNLYRAFAAAVPPRKAPIAYLDEGSNASDYQERYQRDKEWRDRAKRRRPFQ